MKRKGLLLMVCAGIRLAALAQVIPDKASTGPELLFVSDTQQPMLVEKIVLKPNHNLEATADIFAAILKEHPSNVYMLGDVVGLGYANHKWRKVDRFLDSARRTGTDVCAVLGNHEVMGRVKKGEKNFQQRFPMNVNTGYVSITDSVAVVLLNSNFNALSAADEQKQQHWYKSTLQCLDETDAVKIVIVCCHHAPYSNSKVVNCSKKVQDHFVADYIQSRKAQLFITGHAHAFEHFKVMGKDFLVIGGGGGLHQPLNNGVDCIPDLAADYKPMFHYLSVKRDNEQLLISSHYLQSDFSGFGNGISFCTSDQPASVANNAGR